MRFIIDNYTTTSSSQALYFAEHIHAMEEHEVYMLKKGKESIFDAFDRFNPDTYITATNLLSRDAVMYITQQKNINLIVSINGTNNSDVLEIESAILQAGINCPFFISNLRDDKQPMTKKIKVTRFMEAVDTNFDNELQVNYNIDKLVIAGKESPNIRNYHGTFHVASHDQKMADVADLCLPINVLTPLLANYREVVFQEFGNYIPQLFFHSLAIGKPTYYDLEDQDKAEMVDDTCDKVFGVGNKLNYSCVDKITDFKDLQEKVLAKHTSSNRARSLLSQLPKKK